MKIKLFCVLFCFIAASSLCVGCETETMTNTELNLETYTGSDEASYEYLEKVSFRNEKEYVKLPVLIDSEITDESEAYGEKAGISLTVKMHSANNNSLGSLMDETYWSQKSGIEEDGGVFSEDPSYIEGDNFYILQQSFDKTVDDLTYPCLLVIKYDTLSMGGFAETTVVVDNTKTNEESHAVLTEILGAYGVSTAEDAAQEN